MNNLLRFLTTSGPIDEIDSIYVSNLEFLTTAEMAVLPRPRIVHSHFKPEMLPEDMLKDGRKIVLMFRNPKDTAVSMFHFLQRSRTMNTSGLHISWDTYIDYWIKHNSKWLFILYERILRCQC